MRGPVNRHAKLREGELTRRYLRLRDEEPAFRDDEIDHDHYLDGDDYWSPYEASALDFHLQNVWEQVLGIAFAPSFSDFLPATRETWSPSTDARGTVEIDARAVVVKTPLLGRRCLRARQRRDLFGHGQRRAQGHRADRSADARYRAGARCIARVITRSSR